MIGLNSAAGKTVKTRAGTVTCPLLSGLQDSAVRQRSRYLLLYMLVALTTLAFAQVIGYLINVTIPENTTIEINSLIHFTHIRNHGGVFGLLQGSGWLFALISMLLLAAVSLYLALGSSIQRYEFVCFGFIVGGGASNIIDRLVYGSVIDFIDIQHIPYWNYVFNTADVMVHVGIWPMLLLGLFGGQQQAQEQPD
jgi:signal peptidase II